MFGKWWWKFLGVAIMLYAITKGLTSNIPDVSIVEQSIRNLYYHVPMWFVMIIFMFISSVYSILYLRNEKLTNDRKAQAFTEIGILLGICGSITGAIWARATWGSFWPNDPKLNGVAVGMLIYFSLLVLRGAITDERQRAKIGGIYNIFVFPIFLAFIYVMPKLVDVSLHPGSGDTVQFTMYNNSLNADMRMVFYPAIIGWGLLFLWVVNLRYRVLTIIGRKQEQLLK